MGGGRLGLTLSEILIKDKHDVTLIESNEILCSNAAIELDALVICGSGTNKRTLDEANIREADVFVAATGNDESNLLSCILVRDMSKAKLIARVSNPDHEEAFKDVGIHAVINPERTAASYIERIVTRPNVADLVTFARGDAEIIDMTITNKKVVGEKIGSLSPTNDYAIIATYDKNKMYIPQPDTILAYGDKISLLIIHGAEKKVYKKFAG